MAHNPHHGHDPMIGQVLEGLYEVERLIAQGGMGSIYIARQMRLNYPLAIKILRPDLSSDEKIVKRFIREALAINQLRHPHTVQILDAGRTPDGIHFIVMEHLPGMSLDRKIAQGRMRPNDGMSVVLQSATALGQAHRKGIIHRDLKPANIFLVDAEGMEVYTKVLDFGIAKFHPDTAGKDMTKLTVAGSTMGTPHHMSPEQIQGHEIDPRSDIYSLGVILWEALVGTPPYRGDSPMEVFMGHIEDPIPPMISLAPDLQLPPGLEDVARKAMQKRPVDRFQTMEDFKDALEEVKANVTASESLSRSAASIPSLSPAMSQHAMTPLAPQNQQRNMLMMLIAFAAIALIVVIVVIAFAISSSSENETKPDDGEKQVAAAEPEPPPPPAAAIKILSEPLGALVIKDGKNIGITPYVTCLDEVGDDAMLFKLQKTGYEEQTISVLPEADKVAAVYAPLKPKGAEPTKGPVNLKINFNTVGGEFAEVAVEGAKQTSAKTTPFTFDIPVTTTPTSIMARVKSDGYFEEVYEIPIRGGVNADKPLELFIKLMRKDRASCTP